MDTNLKQLDDQLNAMIIEGRALDALHRLYDDDCTMQENDDAPCVGREANLAREQAFFAAVEDFHGEVVAQTVGDGVTMTEWNLDLTLKGQPRATTRQVAVRRWRNGKITSERFYHR